MNKEILKSIAELNAYQKIGYKWPAKIDGSIGDVKYKDAIILHGNPDNFTYCCGLTLQAYLMACERIGKDLGSVSQVRKIRRVWFIAEFKEPLESNGGAVDALEPLGYGRRVKLEDALEGDLIQFWRKNGSGHSAVFINQYTENGYRALKYWSSQPSTNGIGYRTEWFDEAVPNPITTIHVCRPL